MLDVHSSLKKYHSHQDPLVQVADSVARESKVLCLDEFFVNDVADAAILNRLFSRLWENGLQRNLFLPFIEKLKVCCTCVGSHPFGTSDALCGCHALYLKRKMQLDLQIIISRRSRTSSYQEDL